MIKFFLSNQPEIQPKTKSIIKNHLCKKRKYQPFHIDCDLTKKKICYCVKNPVLNIQINNKQKQRIWEKYQQAEKFYVGPQQKDLKKAEQEFDKIKSKIQCLSKKELVDFVKSIRQQKNLMGEIIEY